jgi:nicotinate-nucleotide adenylyltransferase
MVRYKNIAIFGGSFDPIHIGHEMIINKCLVRLDIDMLYIVPTFLNLFKNKAYLDANIRFHLLNKLFKDNKKINISDYEIKQNKPVPTIETVKYIKNTIAIDKIYLIVGADNLNKLHLWKRIEELKQLVQFVVISRDHKKLKDDIIQFIKIDLNIKVSSTQVRNDLILEYIPLKIQKEVEKLCKIEQKIY